MSRVTVEPNAPKASRQGGRVFYNAAHVGWVLPARAAWWKKADWWVAFNTDGVRVGWGDTMDAAVRTLR